MACLSISMEMPIAWLRMPTPKHVLLIVGMNKVVKSEEDALHRARNEAAPINAQRFGIDTPCSKTEAVLTVKSTVHLLSDSDNPIQQGQRTVSNYSGG